MASQVGNGILRAALSAAAAMRLSDRELLAQFVKGDQAAFAAIVKRHTGLVLGVCQRVLPTVQDAEDACQATFLVLARKAKTGRWQPSIANWLYTTARRIASETNRSAARRMKRELLGAPSAPVSALDQMTGREAFAALDEELDKLPAIHREPLVLCYLQGLTRDQAAIRLQVPPVTLKGQLDRGRKKLADALTRRGIDIGAGLIAIAATSVGGGYLAETCGIDPGHRWRFAVCIGGRHCKWSCHEWIFIASKIVGIRGGVHRCDRVRARVDADQGGTPKAGDRGVETAGGQGRRDDEQ